MRTAKGPSKLKQALVDPGLEPDLRAHAAVNLIRIDEHRHVQASLAAVAPDERSAIAAAMAPRLWGLARLPGKMTVPTPLNERAKDTLFELRPLASVQTRAVIDGYLVDWLAGGYYERLAQMGRIRGEIIVAAIGKRAAPPLIARLDSLVGASPGQDGRRLAIGPNLLLGLAVTGSADAVAKLLDVAQADLGDPTLARRALAALCDAYVEPRDFAAPDPKALAAHLERLVQIASDRRQRASERRSALALVAAAGMPECLPPLVDAIRRPNEAAAFTQMAAEQALRCGAVAAIIAVAEALPPGRTSGGGELEANVVRRIALLLPRREVAARARILLTSDSWVARLIGIEILARIGGPQDAAAIRPLTRDPTRPRGWAPAGQGESVGTAPTLGARARQVSRALEALAKGAKK